SHIEQVTSLPPGARILFESPGCPIAGYAVGTQVFTIQHHPEMTHAFIEDLVAEYAEHVGQDVTNRAYQSLATGVAHRSEIAEEIASFFEMARV
ncbi:MAG: type 1 glutamine amidotransferase, partial [Pseudomonadota bacterium]